MGIIYICSAEEEVVVVGGGTSADQAAVFLAETSRVVHMHVRSVGLIEKMSRYFVYRRKPKDRIQASHRDSGRRRRSPRMHLLTKQSNNTQTRQSEEHKTTSFVMTGVLIDAKA